MVLRQVGYIDADDGHTYRLSRVTLYIKYFIQAQVYRIFLKQCLIPLPIQAVRLVHVVQDTHAAPLASPHSPNLTSRPLFFEHLASTSLDCPIAPRARAQSLFHLHQPTVFDLLLTLNHHLPLVQQTSVSVSSFLVPPTQTKRRRALTRDLLPPLHQHRRPPAPQDRGANRHSSWRSPARMQRSITLCSPSTLTPRMRRASWSAAEAVPAAQASPTRLYAILL